MKINYTRAKALCTESEFALVTAAKVDSLAKATPATLRKLAAQSRKLSDKWLDQSRKQSDAARSVEKYELFKNVLTRIEAKMEAIAAKAEKAARKAVAKKAVKKVAKKAGMPFSDKPLPLAKQAKQNAITTKLRVEKSGLTSRMRGHVSAQGRRNQAARSARKR